MLRNTFIVYPFFWFITNMVWLVAFSVGLNWYMAYLLELTLGAKSCRLTVNRRIDIDKMMEYIDTYVRPNMETLDTVVVPGESDIVKVAWQETDKRKWCVSSLSLSLSLSLFLSLFLSPCPHVHSLQTLGIGSGAPRRR